MCLPSLVKPMDVDADVRGTALRLTLMLVDIGYDVASVSTPRPRCEALKFRLRETNATVSARTSDAWSVTHVARSEFAYTEGATEDHRYGTHKEHEQREGETHVC